MRERFPRRQPGQGLSARHVNRLGRAVERISAFVGLGGATTVHAGSVVGMAPGFPRQGVATFEVTSVVDADAGTYGGKVRWYSYGDKAWKTEGTEYNLDAGGVRLTLNVGDKVVAYWDGQRGMFVPVCGCECNPLADFGGSAGTVPSTNQGNWAIEFELEISTTGYGGWQAVNGRVYAANGNVDPDAVGGGTVSGCGIYTFLVTTAAFLRVRVRTHIDDGTVSVGDAALRLEAKCQGGVQHSSATPFEPGLVVPLSVTEASVNNDGPADGWPEFTPYGIVIVQTPAGESWTVAAELCLLFQVTAVESSSASSPSSVSSISSISASSASSASSPSSASSASSVSGSSLSSTSTSTSLSTSTSSSSSSGPCHLCVDGTYRDPMYAQISGVAAKSPVVCASCSSWNVKWTMPASAPTECEWQCTTGMPCGGTLLFLGMRMVGADLLVTLSVRVSGAHVGEWRRTFAGVTKIDCSTISLTTWYDSATPDAQCDWGGSTALVTNT